MYDCVLGGGGGLLPKSTYAPGALDGKESPFKIVISLWNWVFVNFSSAVAMKYRTVS